MTVPPKTTGLLAMGFNLDANAAVGDTFSTAVTVYDSLGAPHVLDTSFTKTGTGAWTYDVSIDGGEVSGGTAGTPVSIATGTLQFDASGNLDPATGVNGAAPADVAIGPSAALTNGALPLSFTWDLVAADGTSPVSGFASPSVVLSVAQDGNAPGNLRGIQVDAGGVIVGRFSNGQSLDLARLSVAVFRNPEGLLRLSGNAFGATRASGEPVVGEAGAGGRGNVMGGTLEMSNVDIAEQFTSLIIAQRGYQASARVINTTDELTQEAINLKR
jgi:flagellar hook protein FlgE